MKIFGAILFSVLLLVALPSGVAQAQATAQDQATFDTLFKDEVLAARRSRDREEVAELITEMVDTAQRIPDSPGVGLLIYESAIELAVTKQHFAQAIEVAQVLRSTFPEAESASDERILDLFDTAFRGVAREDRREIAMPYIDLMVEIAHQAEDQGDLDRASELLREALSIARTVDTDRVEEIEAALSELSAARSLRDQIDRLTTSVEANPRNVSAAIELTMLLVLSQQDPARASQYVELTRNPELIEVVKIASAGPGEATAPAALRVGDWYMGLSDDQPESEAYLLGESYSYYERFLEVYPRDDALKSRVMGMQQAVTIRLGAIDEARAEAARGRWVDLIGSFNVRRHAIGDNIRLQGGHLYAASSDFVLALTPETDYELRIDLRFVQGDNGLDIYLPLGEERGAVYHYSRWENTKCQIDGAGNTEDERFMLTEGREVELLVEVQFLDEGEVRLVTRVDDEVCIEWEGEIDKLNVNDRFRAPEAMGNIFRVDCHGRFVFRAIEVRELMPSEEDSEAGDE